MAALLECRCRTSSRSYQTVAPGGAATLKPTSFAWRECVGGPSGARAITPCRVVGHRLAIRQAEKAMQRQGSGAPPGDFPLGLQTFKLADEQHAEVAAWRGAANAVLVVLLAQHLDGFVELGQHLIAPVVKRVAGSTARRLPLPAAFRRLLSLAMPSRLELHHTNVHRVSTNPLCQRTVRTV